MIMTFLEFDGFFEHNHPDIVKNNLPEIEEFSRVSCMLYQPISAR